MAHYVGVLVPLEAGGWRALVPDVPELQVEGASLDLAIFHAANALTEIKQKLNGSIPAPRDLTEIKANNGWAADRNVDWHTCVVTMIPARG